MNQMNRLLRSLNNRYVVLFLFSFLVGAFFHTFNIHTLMNSTPEKVRLGETVLTSDDVIYIKPVMNFVGGKGWTDGSVGRQQYFSRPPGYSLFILPFYALFGLKKGLFFLKYTQLFLFSVSAVYLLKILEKLTNSNKFSFILSVLYGIFPIASGFVFYTLTEAITPAFLIFYVYFSQKGWISTSKTLFLKASLILSFLVLIRPVLGMFLIPLLVLVFYSQKNQLTLKKRLLQVFIFLSISLIPLLCWQVRVVNICGEFPGLYPVYDKEVKTIYRPTHRTIWAFGKCWGISGKDFHEYVGPIWEQVIYPDSIQGNPIKRFISIIPTEIVRELGEERIQLAFLNYQHTVNIQKPYLLSNSKLPSTLVVEEQKVIGLFNKLITTYKSKHWFKYHVLVPIHYLKEMSFHSNLNLYIFQHPWRGNLGMESARILSLFVHFGVFVILFLSFFVPRLTFFTRLLSLSTLFYVLFLAYYFRELEERYTLPILPILFLIASEVITHSKFYFYVKAKFQKG